MSKKKKDRAPVPVRAAPPAPAIPSWSGWSGVLALASAITCGLITWLSSDALNSDGVAYLDLARLARAGDWGGFVQGYWSPLYPAIIAALSTLTGTGPLALVRLAHVVNGIAACAGIGLLWWWGRQMHRPFVTRALLATFLLASTGLPRIEAVTPDVILLGVMAWIGYELIWHQGRRPTPSGIALGVAFLAKTSVWPWLLLTLPLRLWGAWDRAGRLQMLRSSAVTLLIAAIWIVPLSLKSGHLTAGSAGRLNYDWYLGSSDARTPDTHTGTHRAYREITVDSLHRVEVIDFAEADRWTYAPWSDPTAWSTGILTSNARSPDAGALLAYWGRQAKRTFGPWSLLVLLGVLLPVAVAFRQPELGPLRARVERPTLVALLLGLAGLVQFVLIHSEPRLIAPFVLLVGLAALHPFIAAPIPAGPERATGRNIATAAGVLAVIWMAGSRIEFALVENAQLQGALATIRRDNVAPPMIGHRWRQIAVVGPAMPVAPAAFMAGAHIVAQLPPRSVPVAQDLAPDRQLSLLGELFTGKADIIWITDATGSVRSVPVPPR